VSIAALKSELATARAFLNAVLFQVGDRWDTQVYSDGAAWTVRQLLIHLAVTDQGQSNTVTAIAAGGNPVPEDFDINRYNARSVEKRADTTPEQARQQLSDSRAKFLEWLDQQDESVLEKSGRHGGTMQTLTIAGFLQTMADHERQHAQDIAQVLEISV